MLSGRPLEDLDGDRSIIDDTPSDPFIPAFSRDLAMTAITLAGRPYSFLRKNIMSTWTTPTPQNFRIAGSIACAS